jgi:hypothetical protein
MSLTVVIPTTCESGRAELLARAISSVKAKVLLVVNGNRYDSGLLETLRASHTVYCWEQGHAAKARSFGRTLVKTPFFGFLDDDDEYLPRSVEKRLQPMLADRTIDAVVGNGLIGQKQYISASEFVRAREDPVRAILEFNWLLSPSALFRTEAVGPEYFVKEHPHLEWTLTGFRLALTRKLAFINEPSYRINDTPGSLSKRDSYKEAIVPVIESMLSLTTDPALRRAIKRKLAAAHHDMAEHYLSTDKRRARRHHMASLRGPGSLRYLPFTRKVV